MIYKLFEPNLSLSFLHVTAAVIFGGSVSWVCAACLSTMWRAQHRDADKPFRTQRQIREDYFAEKVEQGHLYNVTHKPYPISFFPEDNSTAQLCRPEAGSTVPALTFNDEAPKKTASSSQPEPTMTSDDLRAKLRPIFDKFDDDASGSISTAE